MAEYKVAVIERYPDGTKWVHYFQTDHTAREAMKLGQEAHPARTYEIREVA